MPGEISRSYDPEGDAGELRDEVTAALDAIYTKITAMLNGSPPMRIDHLMAADLPLYITGLFTEKEWRLLRFSLERAKTNLFESPA